VYFRFRCLPNGCVAEVVMDEKLIGQLENAKTATFIIFKTPEEDRVSAQSEWAVGGV
jgi:invasion protein IalB